MTRWLLIAVCFVAFPAQALQLDLPRNARQTAARDSALDQAAIPVTPFSGTGMETELVEGNVRRRAYKITTPGITPLQIVEPLRSQIEAAGFDILLDCNQAACGGYDFRFAAEVLPAPNMIVNIRSYHYLTAKNDATGIYVTLLASAVGSAAYLQVIDVDTQVGGEPVDVTAAATGSEQILPLDAEPPSIPLTSLVFELLENGSAVFHDLTFELGTTALQDTPSSELEALAELLADRPNLRVAVVGHTDSTGDLGANIEVSRARAAAVRNRLVEELGATAEQIDAEGMGYLAPRASNLTAEGREANRRVEVILISDGF